MKTSKPLPITPIVREKGADKILARLERNTEVVDRGYESPCHEYRGAINNAGYAKMTFRLNGRHIQVYAHRLSWVLATGRDAPSHLVLDHKCQNRCCRNHEHLQPVLPRTNSRLVHSRA
jgi:hypothetical protein